MLHPCDTRCDCPTRIEIVLNDFSEWVLVKYIAKHNHPLSTTPSKAQMHRSRSTIHRTSVVQWLVSSHNNEGIGPSDIVSICNAASGWREQNLTPEQCAEIIRSERKNIMERECLG